MSLKDKYHSEYAAEYRECLAAAVEGRQYTINVKKPFSKPSTCSKSSTTPDYKNINQHKVGTLQHTQSYHDMEPYHDNPSPIILPDKTRNEAYFARLGQENMARPDNVPPSQGGRYTGFGNSSYEPSQPTPSAGVPDLNAIVHDPMNAITKGLSFLGAGVKEGVRLAAHGAGTLGHTVNEHVIKPTTEKVRDPEFQREMKGYISGLSKTVSETATRGVFTLSSSGSHQSTSTSYNGGPYSDMPPTGNVASNNADSSALGTDDFFHDFKDNDAFGKSSIRSSSPSLQGNSKATTRSLPKKDLSWNGDDDWDKW